MEHLQNPQNTLQTAKHIYLWPSAVYYKKYIQSVIMCISVYISYVSVNNRNGFVSIYDLQAIRLCDKWHDRAIYICIYISTCFFGSF